MNIHTDAKRMLSNIYRRRNNPSNFPSAFVCPISECGKAFNVRSNMRRHLLTHKEYQPGSDEEGSPMSGYAYPKGRNTNSTVFRT